MRPKYDPSINTSDCRTWVAVAEILRRTLAGERADMALREGLGLEAPVIVEPTLQGLADPLHHPKVPVFHHSIVPPFQDPLAGAR